MQRMMKVACVVSLLLMACGDDGSTSVKGEHGDTPYCTVKKTGDGATQEIYEPGVGWGESGVKFKGGKAVSFANMTFEMSDDGIEKKCEELEEDADTYDKGSFTCGKNGASFTITIPEEEAFSLKEILKDMKSECEDYKEDWAEKFGDEEYGSDNADDENASSSKMKSSSSTKSKSSSSFKSDSVNVSGSEKYNAITDKRDGKKYRVVKIGNQVWFLDNLAFEGTDEYPLAGEVFAYDRYDNGNHVVLYNFAAAMNDDGCANNVCNAGGNVVQGACPDGWAVPSDAAWDCLSANLSANLREFMNFVEFFSQATGEYGSAGIKEDNISRYWSSLEDGAFGASEWYYVAGDGLLNQDFSKNYGYGVRCIAVDDVVLDAYVEAPIVESSSSWPFGESSSSYEIDLCNFLGDCESSSSEGEVSSSSFNLDTTFARGEFVDERDGETYGYIDYYGVQWMSENLRFSDSTLVHELEGSVWCIGEENEFCERGMLYTFDAAENVCPDGWKLPTLEDWESLAYYGEFEMLFMYDAVFEQMNMEATGEHGTYSVKLDDYARFWTAESSDGSKNRMVYFDTSTKNLKYQYFDGQYGYAVRCIKD